jgi:hypothetical protein
MRRDRLILYPFISSIVYFVAASLTAMFLYPDYDNSTQFLSALGVGENGGLLNTGLILLGVTSIPFYFMLNLHFKQNMNIFLQIALILGVISGFLLVGIGYYISDGETSSIHDLFAMSYFLILQLFFILIPLGLYKISYSKWKYVIIVSGILVIITFLGLFIEEVNQYIFQKLIVYGHMILQLLIAQKVKSNN